MSEGKKRQQAEVIIKRLILCLMMCFIVAASEMRAYSSYQMLAVQQIEAQEAVDGPHERALKSFAEGEKLRAEWKKQSLQEAINKYMEAYEYWLTADNQNEAARALEAVGNTHFILSEYQLALAAYDKALAIRRDIKDELGLIGVLNNIGYTYIYLGRNQQALSYLKQAMTRLDKLHALSGNAERVRKEAQVRNSLGEVYYSLSDVKNALDCFSRALALWTEVADLKGEALAQLNLGYMNYNFGDLKGAYERYNQSLTLWLSIGDKRGEAFSRTALGGVQSFLGEQQLALDLHNEALNIFRTIGDREGEAVTLNGIGTAYEGLNNPQEALNNYDHAMRLYQEIGNRDFEALAKVYIAAIYKSEGATEQALDYYSQSLLLLRKVGNRRIETYALKDVATIYGSAGQTRKALDEYERALKLYKRFEDRRGQADTLNSIADIYYSSGRAKEALALYKRSLSLSQEAQDRGAEITTLYKLARAERVIGDVNQALSLVEAAIKLIEGLRIKAGDPDLRASYFASVHQHYELYIDLLMNIQKQQLSGDFAAAALYASERSRARSLLEMLAEAKVEIYRGADPALVEQADSLGHLLDIKGEYQMHVLSGRHSKDDVEEINKEISSLEAQYDKVQTQILEQSSLYVTLRQPKLLRLEDIQAELKDNNTLLLEYALGEERSYLWAITSESFRSYELPGRATLEEAARKVYGLLIARQPVRGESPSQYEERIAISDAQYGSCALSLSRMLLGQVANQLENRRLIIIADGALQYVPFEALPIASSGGGKSRFAGDFNLPENITTLVEEHEIVYLQSASMLAALRKERRLPESSRKGIAVMADPVFGKDDSRVSRKMRREASPGIREAADIQQSLRELGAGDDELNLSPLPSTLHEADMIVEAAPWGATRVATGFEANKTVAMSAEFGRYKIIHFATHGIINNEHPMLSGVVLTLVDQTGNAQSGFLRLPDIYKLNLSADLVVLSACKSALGKQINGEGFVGLTRGFMYAGSRSVLASLWKVDDEATAELMAHFYRAMLKEGLPPAAALQKAKQAMQANPKWHHPFYWAAFVLQGEYREPIRVDGFGTTYAPFAVVIAASSIAVFFFMRRVWKKLHSHRQSAADSFNGKTV